MSLSQTQLQLPETLQAQLLAFRKRVWTIKLIEAACGAVFGVFVGFLATFALDRLLDTPASVRLGIFIAAIAGCALIPLALHRWVWRHRRLEQLARLLSRKHPSVGDQLLGIIELVHNESEQARSLALCQAAVGQVAEVAAKRDFSDSVPAPKHRGRAVLACCAGLAAIALLAVVPAAAKNAWARFLKPWGDTPRYTFAAIDALPDTIIVPHGEVFTQPVKLASGTAWRPESGEMQVGMQLPVTARLNAGQYEFEIPPQIDAARTRVRIGDFRRDVTIQPTLRPELSGIEANVELPKYLERTKPVHKDVRGGTLSLVKGSRATVAVTATRELTGAKVDGAVTSPSGAKVVSPVVAVDQNRKLEFEWTDKHGLAGREPFVVSINAREDETPSIACEELPRQKVVLDSEQLTFKVRATDDFGVKHVGIEWTGIDKTNFKDPAKGEKILSAGGSDKETLDLTGTFSAKALGIEPQPIQARLFAEDFFPGRERAYSGVYTFYVLNPEQHAIWMTEQLSKWHRQSLEVRDREMALHEINKQLRDLEPAELDQADNRKRLDKQAVDERANGRRLSNLVHNGEDLVKQASRNPEFGVGHLEKWAEMLQILKDISGNRMPSVADLLKQGAQAPQLAMNQGNPSKPNPNDGKPQSGQPSSAKPSEPPRQAGQNRATTKSSGGKEEKKEGEEEPKKPNGVPSIQDIESTQQPLKPKEGESPPPESKGQPSLGLPNTMLAGGGPKSDKCPAGDKVEEAVKQQQDLLVEFDKIADELNRVLANLEGSTLVKRLKAASRQQNKVAGRLGDHLGDAFGVAAVATKDTATKLFTELSKEESKGTLDISNIMDDIAGYYERRRMANFKTVLDDMRKQDVIGGLRQLGDDLKKENGLSMAQCEFWSDTMDRWAEDLVDPASGGT